MTSEDISYGKAFHAGCVEIGQEIKNEKLDGMDQIWGACRKWRVNRLNNVPKSDTALVGFKNSSGTELKREIDAAVMPFNTRRTGSSGTPIFSSQRYGYILERVKDKNGVTIDEHGEESPAIEEKKGESSLTMCMELDGKNTALTKMVLYTKEPKVAGERDGLMIHTKPEHIGILRGAAMSFFDKNMGNSTWPRTTTTAEKMEAFGKLHWMLSHLMPDERGSAAKSEMLIRATAHSVGINLPPFKEDFCPDLEAFVTPLNKYMENYAAQFETTETMTEREAANVNMNNAATASNRTRWWPWKS